MRRSETYGPISPSRWMLGQQRPALWLARLVVFGSAVYAASYLWVWYSRFDGGNDFFVFWSAARWVAEYGLTPGLYSLEGFRSYQAALFGSPRAYHPFPYPPTLAPFLEPLSRLPLVLAYMIAMSSTLLLFLWAASGRRYVRALPLLASPATLTTWVAGQIAFATSALLIGGIRLLDRKPVLAGVLIGLLSVKPQLGLLLPIALIALRAWRTFAVAAAVVALLPLPSMFLGGREIWTAWIELIPVIATTLAHNPDSATRLMVSPVAALVMIGIPFGLAKLIQIPISIAVAAAAFTACRRHRPSDMMAAMLGVGGLLATPYAFFYDLPIVAFAAVVLAGAGLRTGFRRGELLAITLAWALPIFAIDEFTVPGATALALALIFAVLLRRMSDPTT